MLVFPETLSNRLLQLEADRLTVFPLPFKDIAVRLVNYYLLSRKPRVLPLPSV